MFSTYCRLNVHVLASDITVIRRRKTMYHQFRDEIDQPYGSYEVWVAWDGNWYWWPCFPGCLPDGEPFGPFESEDEAVIDATELN